MVSKNPNPAEGFYLDGSGAAVTGIGQVGAEAEDLSKKIRKPHTITKSREIWTEPEHDKFLEALQLSVVMHKSTSSRFRRAGQMNICLLGRKEKLPILILRKHPKMVLGALQSSGLLEPGYVLSPDSPSIPRDPIASAAVSTSTSNSVQTASVSNVSKERVAFIPRD